MTVFSFEIDSSETEKIKAVLKAFGVKKLKIQAETKLSKEEFEEKLSKSKSGKGTLLHSKQDISDFFNSL